MLFKSRKKNKEKTHLLTDFSDKSGYAESFRTLRTNLHFAAMDQDLRSVCITSTVEKEGKTNSVANLSITMARTGNRVLMIDSDLRKPGLTKRYNMEKAHGLTELVSNTLGTLIPRGLIKEYGLSDLITLYNLQNRTGILNITDSDNEVDISFFNGDITDIFWKNRPEDKKLASTLVTSGLLTNDQAVMALGHQKKSEHRLGTILTTMGLVSPKDLKRHLAVHVFEAFKKAATMYDGAFTFTKKPIYKVKGSLPSDVNFDKLFKEFLSSDDQIPYIITALESAVQPMDQENLFLLPSGKVPPNPSEMIGSKRMAFALSHLIDMFDFTVIDTPPVMPVSDALVMAPRTNGVIMVIRAGRVNQKVVKQAVSQLENSKAVILGSLLNRVDFKKEKYYRYYRKYYSSYYGGE